MILWATTATVAKGGYIEHEMHVFSTRSDAHACKDRLISRHKLHELQLIGEPPMVTKFDLTANAAGLADALMLGAKQFKQPNVRVRTFTAV